MWEFAYQIWLPCEYKNKVIKRFEKMAENLFQVNGRCKSMDLRCLESILMEMLLYHFKQKEIKKKKEE